jgi:hypothetical protein
VNENDFYGIASIVVAFFVGLAILTPVLAFCARFAMKPVMETWMKMRQSETTDQEKILQDRRIALLEAELQSVTQLLQHRVDSQEFDRALSAKTASQESKLPPL